MTLSPFLLAMAGQLFVRLALLFAFFSLTSAIYVSRTVDLYGEYYYLAQEPVAPFPGSIGNKDILPVTVIAVGDSVLTDKSLKKTIEEWKKYDDVLTAPFLKSEFPPLFRYSSDLIEIPRSYRTAQ